MKRLKVASIDEFGAAHSAGVQVGDILDAYDNTNLYAVDVLLDAVANARGESHMLILIRDSAFIQMRCPPGRLGVHVIEVELVEAVYQFSREEFVKREAKALAEKANGVLLTTSPILDGYHTEVVEIIMAECAFGIQLFRDFFAGVSDMFGGRNNSTQTVLRDARTVCLTELRKEAARVGANAVIAVDLDYSEFTGGGKSMLFLVASGTAVRATRSK